MINSILDDVKNVFRSGTMVVRIISVNIGVYIAVNIVRLVLAVTTGGNHDAPFIDFLHFFCVSRDLTYDLTHPWVFLTNIFLHEDFGHILWNMLSFYWFGSIVGDDLLGQRRVLPIYIWGGVAGNLLYVLGANTFSYAIGGYALGASAAVMAFLVIAAVKAPDYRIRLLFLGEVPIKYIALGIIFLDMIAIANRSNVGGQIGHFGGVLFGWAYINLLNNGWDLARPINRVIDFVSGFLDKFSKNPPQKRPFQSNQRTQQRTQSTNKATNNNRQTDGNQQEKIDQILDKIKESGYESLSQEEKEYLFKASQK